MWLLCFLCLCSKVGDIESALARRMLPLYDKWFPPRSQNNSFEVVKGPEQQQNFATTDAMTMDFATGVLL